MPDLVINYGLDIFKTSYAAVERARLRERLGRNDRVLIKPNLVLAKHPNSGATTHPQVVDALITYLAESGVSDIIIAESAWIGGDTKAAFDVCGFSALAKKHGVPLIDLKGSRTRKKTSGDLPIEIFSLALDCDFIINVPVLKAHCQTRLTCCLKNLKGLIPDFEKRRFHSLGLHRPIACLNAAVKQAFCLVDAVCGDINFEEGGNPLRRDMIIAGYDPVLIDSYCARLLGYAPLEIEYIALAEKMGVGNLCDEKRHEIHELNADKKPAQGKAESDIVRRYAPRVDDKSACSACYSALISGLIKSKNNNVSEIKIGQGYKNETGEEIGVGNCCKGFSRRVLGCPPKADEIAAFLDGV